MVGPAPKLTSATTRSGTEPPDVVGTGRFWIVARLLPRILVQRDADRDLAVGQREFGAVLVDVAQRRDADRLAERRGGDAHLGGQVEARPDRDFGPLQIAADAGRHQFGQAAHLLDEAVCHQGELRRIVAAERDRDVAAAAAALLRLERDPRIGDRD